MEEKISYEKLEEVAKGLSDRVYALDNQNKQLINQVKQLSEFAAFKRLDYLFKIVEMSNKFSIDFVENCINEIETTMTIIPEDNNESQESIKDLNPSNND